jgi:UTP--glucose-1-phosphate uridylyltransferase
MPAGNYLSHFGLHAFGPGVFESLEYLIKNDVREKGEIQLTAAQEHLRAAGGKYYITQVKGQRYDTGVPYGLMETQLALGLNGVHRTEMCEAIARILAMQVRA